MWKVSCIQILSHLAHMPLSIIASPSGLQWPLTQTVIIPPCLCTPRYNRSRDLMFRTAGHSFDAESALAVRLQIGAMNSWANEYNNRVALLQEIIRIILWIHIWLVHTCAGALYLSTQCTLCPHSKPHCNVRWRDWDCSGLPITPRW